MAAVKATATAIVVNLVPATVYTGQTSQASVGVVPPGAAVDFPGVVLWGNLQGGITLTPNADGTATVQALSIVGSFSIEAQIVSNGIPITGIGTLAVIQGYTGLQETNSAPQNANTLTPEIPLGGSFTLTPTLLPLGCTAPIDAGSWTVSPSKPGNAVAINQTTGVVTVTGNVLGSWSCTVSFTSLGRTISTSLNTGVNVVARATSIEIDVYMPPDGITFGPTTIQLLQGQTGTLVCVPSPGGATSLDGPPLWQTSDPTIVTVGLGLSSATGYSVAFNVVGSSGTATITCQGRSGGVLVQATLAITAVAQATSLVVSCLTLSAVVAVPVPVVAVVFPVGTSIRGNVQWSVTYPQGFTADAFVVPVNATVGILVPLAPGFINIVGQARTPSGTISGGVELSINPAPRKIGVQVTDAVPGVLGFNGGFPPGAQFTVNRTGTTHAVSLLVPSDAEVDAGSWRVIVDDPTQLSVTIDPNTGALAITPLVRFGSSVIIVTVASGSGALNVYSGFLVFVGDPPIPGDGTLAAFAAALGVIMEWTPTASPTGPPFGQGELYQGVAKPSWWPPQLGWPPTVMGYPINHPINSLDPGLKEIIDLGVAKILESQSDKVPPLPLPPLPPW